MFFVFMYLGCNCSAQQLAEDLGLAYSKRLLANRVVPLKQMGQLARVNRRPACLLLLEQFAPPSHLKEGEK